MRWGQVKNIMIVVLLAVNAVMFLILVNDYQKVNYIDKAYVEQVVPLLADRGITVSREQIPREKSAVMTRRLAPPGPDMTAFLQALLDQEVAIQPTQSFTCENGNYETENYINFSVKFSEDYLENFSRIEE